MNGASIIECRMNRIARDLSGMGSNPKESILTTIAGDQGYSSSEDKSLGSRRPQHS